MRQSHRDKNTYRDKRLKETKKKETLRDRKQKYSKSKALE